MRVCVFCGSRSGDGPIHADAARRLGTLLATRGHGLVYGGGNIGLMGVVADAALAAGGEAIGVIPHHLEQLEVAHPGLTQLHVVDSMEAEVADLSERFETRKIIDRAKSLLQSKFSMSEPEAFRWIQKTSMDKRLTMREGASAILASTTPAEGSAAVRQARPDAG